MGDTEGKRRAEGGRARDRQKRDSRMSEGQAPPAGENRDGGGGV